MESIVPENVAAVRFSVPLAPWWIVLYIERWLKAPMQEEDGQLIPREKGTPQGGVITPRTQKITSVLIGC